MRNETAAALKGFLNTCCGARGEGGDEAKKKDPGSPYRPCLRMLEAPAPLADAAPLEIPDYCAMNGIICAR